MGSVSLCLKTVLDRFFAVLSRYELFEGAEGACSNAYALAVDTNNLKVYVLATLRGDVGVAAGLAENGTLSAQLANTGHRSIAIVGKIMAVG